MSDAAALFVPIGGEAIEAAYFAVAPEEELLIQASRCGTPSVRIVAFWLDAIGQPCGALLGEPEPGTATSAPFGRVVTAPPTAAWLIAGWQKLSAGSSWLDAARIVVPDRSVRARLDGPLQCDPAGRFVRQRTALPALGLDAIVEWKTAAHGVTAALDLVDSRGTQRALTVELRLPLAVAGATLQAEPRQTATLARTNVWGEFQSLEFASPGLPFGDGAMATYPALAAVDARGRDATVVLGVPPGDPHPFRLRALTDPAGGVVLSWPIGISPLPRAAARRAHVEWFVACGDPQWPLRSGLVQ
ncbi:MAG: hypothetical protein EXR73_01280, partial [Myxococcales bacterium]|nr:hypothetical protein [Myxococcales bacterium]